MCAQHCTSCHCITQHAHKPVLMQLCMSQYAENESTEHNDQLSLCRAIRLVQSGGLRSNPAVKQAEAAVRFSDRCLQTPIFGLATNSEHANGKMRRPDFLFLAGRKPPGCCFTDVKRPSPCSSKSQTVYLVIKCGIPRVAIRNFLGCVL